MLNKKTKVRNLVWYLSFTIIITYKTFNRTKFFSKLKQLKTLKQKKDVRRIWYMIKTHLFHKKVMKAVFCWNGRKNCSLSNIACLQPATLLNMDSFTCSFQRIFKYTYFKEKHSLSAFKSWKKIYMQIWKTSKCKKSGQ